MFIVLAARLQFILCDSVHADYLPAEWLHEQNVGNSQMKCVTHWMLPADWLSDCVNKMLVMVQWAAVYLFTNKWTSWLF